MAERGLCTNHLRETSDIYNGYNIYLSTATNNNDDDKTSTIIATKNIKQSQNTIRLAYSHTLDKACYSSPTMRYDEDGRPGSGTVLPTS